MSLQAATPNLVLASASTARKAVLESAGIRFEAVTAYIDETEIKRGAQAEGLSAGETALILAEMKAMRVGRTRPDSLVIGCDQLLVCNEIWFDKPSNLITAAEQLKALRGQSHVLETAVVCMRGGAVIWHHLARPKLTMRAFSDEFLDAYIEAEGEILTSSVGAYRLENLGIQLFDRVEGEHAAILGLPLLALLGFLRQHRVLSS